MTADSLEVPSLDPESVMLVRIAALISVDAPPASYLLNLGMASEIDIDAEQVRAVLAAVAPIVGTARVASAAGNIARALGLALDLAELEEEAEAGASRLRASPLPVGLSEHPDEHRPKRPILLAID
jgi:hypothetical protein